MHWITAVPAVVSASSAAASVTVWSMAKFAGVNTRLAPPETVRTASPLARATLTVIALAGAALVILRNGSVDLTGDIRFCILAALLYTAAILLTSVLSKQGDALVTGIFQVGFMALFSTAASFLSGTPQLPQSGTEWACILMLAVVCSSFGFALQPLAQRGTTPERTGLFCAINPLVSALLAAVFLHEDLGIAGVAGMALILLSICISGAVSARQARCS